MKIRYILSLWILALPNLALAENLTFRISKRVCYQAEVVTVQLVAKSTTPFSVRFSGRTYESFMYGKYQTVMVGIDYQMKPGTHLLSGVYRARPYYYIPFVFRLKVLEKFPKLKYAPPKRPEAEQKRIDDEQKHKITAIQKMTLQISSRTHFSWPVTPTKVNSPFGGKRCRDSYRGKALNCRYHLGTDYRAAFDENHSKPVAIHSINSGVVAMTASNEIDGNIVVVDHGNGLSSEYLHLSKFLVKKGDVIRRGQKIGIAGKTGSTDAIHLHLTIKMDYGKTLIDPQKFLDQVVR